MLKLVTVASMFDHRTQFAQFLICPFKKKKKNRKQQQQQNNPGALLRVWSSIPVVIIFSILAPLPFYQTHLEKPQTQMNLAEYLPLVLPQANKYY